MNWPTTCRPKDKGGLGILDLERFAQALRLRWLWFKWKHKDRAWNGLEVPCDRQDHDMFAASTVVTIGDRKTAWFWTSSWIQGTTPRSLAPSLLQKAKRKIFGPKSATGTPLDITYPTPLNTTRNTRICPSLGAGKWNSAGGK